MSEENSTTESTDIPTPDAGASALLYVQSVTNLIKAVAWPLVVIVIFVSLKEPVSNILDQVPSLISRSSKITISGVTLEFKERLRAESPPELRKALGELSPEAIRLLIDAGNETHFEKKSNESDEFISALYQLRAKGLFEVAEGKLNYEYCKTCDIRYEATPLGKDAYKIVKDVLIKLLEESR